MTASVITQHLKRFARRLFGTRALELLLGFGALGAALTILLVGGDKPISAAKQHRTVQHITADTVTQQPVERPCRLAGVLRARQRAQLTFTVGGRLKSRPVQVGQRVKKGQLLAQLDARAYQHGLGAAAASRREVRARLAQARRDLRRTRTLVTQGVLPKARLEQIEAQVKSLAAVAKATRVQVAESWRTLRETTLRAPFAGMITDIRLQPGEFAVPGRPVLLLTGDDALEVRVEVPEAVMTRVQVGQRVVVDLPLIGRRSIPGKVRYVGRTTAGPGRLFPIIVELGKRQNLWAGMTAEVVITERRGNALTVPVAAVVNPSGRQPAVYRITDSRVHRVPVRVGILLDARIEIRGKLRAGDRVAVSGHAELLDGDRVKLGQNRVDLGR